MLHDPSRLKKEGRRCLLYLLGKAAPSFMEEPVFWKLLHLCDVFSDCSHSPLLGFWSHSRLKWQGDRLISCRAPGYETILSPHIFLPEHDSCTSSQERQDLSSVLSTTSPQPILPKYLLCIPPVGVFVCENRVFPRNGGTTERFPAWGSERNWDDLPALGHDQGFWDREYGQEASLKSLSRTFAWEGRRKGKGEKAVK